MFKQENNILQLKQISSENNGSKNSEKTTILEDIIQEEIVRKQGKEERAANKNSEIRFFY